MAAVVNWQISVFHIFPFFAPCIAIFSTMRYPSATSSTIITLKPTAKNTVPTLECCPCDISEISSSTTTYSMAPAKKLIRWYILGVIGAVLTILAAGIVVPALSYLLSFAAGAMLYVVVEELIPEMSQGQHSNIGAVFFAGGFSVMMVLDVALG